MGIVDELIARAQPRTVEVPICSAGDLVAAHAAAVSRLAEIMDEKTDGDLEGDPRLAEAAEAVRTIEDQLEEATVVFKMASVSREVWATLLAEHPPTKEMRRAGHDHHPVTFPPAAVAACIVDPPTTVEQVAVLAGTRPDGTPVLPAGEWNKLWSAAINLNVPGIAVPKLSAATELLRRNGHSSTTPRSEGSLEDGSSAGSGAQ